MTAPGIPSAVARAAVDWLIPAIKAPTTQTASSGRPSRSPRDFSWARPSGSGISVDCWANGCDNAFFWVFPCPRLPARSSFRASFATARL